jgi:hypothetical protein
MKASFVPRRLIVNKIKARSAHAGGLSPDLQFWSRLSKNYGKQMRERLGAWSLSPLCPHVRAALRDQSKVRLGSQGPGGLDPDRILWRPLSHHNPGNDAEREQGRR